MKKITFLGNPITLKGEEVKVGDTFKSFKAIDNDMKEFDSATTKGLRIFLSVPSVDTGVCDLELKMFNEKLENLANVSCYAVSMDLPFAQKRWCGAADSNILQAVSDFKDRSFAKATGTYIEELGLLTRAVFVVDASNKVIYSEYVAEVGEQPSFDEILNVIKSTEK